MSKIIKFPVEASSRPGIEPTSNPKDTLMPLPHVDLETVIEMVECLRDIGSYRQDAVREARVAERECTGKAV